MIATETKDVLSTGKGRGTLAVYEMTFEDGASGERQYFLRNGTNETRLYFEKTPELQPGTPLEPGTPIIVSGEPIADGLRVQTVEADPGDPNDRIGVSAQALIKGMPYKARTFGMVLVDTGSGVNITKEEMTKRLFSVVPADKSVKQYYMEVSYGTQDISGEVIGPLMYPMNGRCDTTGLARTLKPMVPMMYDHYLWYIGQRTQACQFSGLAEGGQPERPTNDTWYNGSAGCVVLVQEPGHNFGMMHSSSMTCSGMTAFADDPDSACMHNEYGDRYDPMGGACNHMNAWQKVFEGWLQKCNGVQIKSSGTYTLQPLELACDGPQVLQIPMPKVRPFGRSGGGGLATTENLAFYYLELRTARGFDSTIRTAPTVLVHVAEDFHGRMDRGRHTWLLDMEPTSTRTIEGLGAGKSFMDPAGGVSFTVMSISMDSATIQVNVPGGMGGATCLDDTPFDAAKPLPMCAGVVGPGGTTMDPGTTTPPPNTTPPPKVEALILVDADTEKDIRPVQDMATLDLDQLPPNLTVRVDTDPPVVGSVVFRVDGGPPRTESGMGPYSITGAPAGNFAPWTLPLGAHTVNATPFEAANGGGRMGEPLEIDFTLVRSGVGKGDVAAGGSGALVGSAAGTVAAAPLAGTGASFNPQLTAGSGPIVVPAIAERQQPDSGCACHVPGTGVGSSGTPRTLALGALVLGLFVQRRRARRRSR